ncbi:hypothetical protein EVAR_69696_1 [Eumeta japonica]|uniref:Uncharacterized protein n=1 Tax=Eumeta variegata TaxID=151549 RepID=A0A4C1SGG6_EUMVA|nr:hypothetical protein EVAR_69696_1 [Eumeta japonica]
MSSPRSPVGGQEHPRRRRDGSMAKPPQHNSTYYSHYINESTTECDILIEDEKIQPVKKFVYSGRLFTNEDKHDSDIEMRVNAENKANGALLAV